MALLTVLPQADALALAAEYGFRLESIEPLAAGSVNSNFFMNGAAGERFFARLYEEQGAAGAEFELRLNELLADAKIAVARPRRTLAGELVLTFRTQEGRAVPFSLYERVSGTSLCSFSVTPQHARALGQALAQVHLAPLPGLSVPQGRFGPRELEERLNRVLQAGRADLEASALALLAKLPEVASARDPELVQGLIHGDLFRDNVLFHDGALAALLDFESACVGPFSYDLAVTALAWCYGDEFKADCLLALFEGYNGVRPLSEREKAGLRSEGIFACVRFATTRLTDFSLRTAEGVLPKRDFRRFLARMAALEAGVFERVLAQL